MKRLVVVQTIMLFILLLLLTTVGCQEQSEPAPTLSPMPNTLSPTLPEKGNPKLDSQLNQLIQAEKLGEAASFAEQSNIELVDGDVRVVVECLPDQVDAAVKTAGAVGIVETSYRNLLQVVVPITSLTTLADAESIHFIRLPQYPSPDAKGEVDAKQN